MDAKFWRAGMPSLRSKQRLNQYISLWNSDSHVAELYLRYIFGEPWCKMVRRNLLTNNGILIAQHQVKNAL